MARAEAHDQTTNRDCCALVLHWLSLCQFDILGVAMKPQMTKGPNPFIGLLMLLAFGLLSVVIFPFWLAVVLQNRLGAKIFHE